MNMRTILFVVISLFYAASPAYSEDFFDPDSFFGVCCDGNIAYCEQIPIEDKAEQILYQKTEPYGVGRIVTTRIGDGDWIVGWENGYCSVTWGNELSFMLLRQQEGSGDIVIDLNLYKFASGCAMRTGFAISAVSDLNRAAGVWQQYDSGTRRWNLLIRGFDYSSQTFTQPLNVSPSWNLILPNVAGCEASNDFWVVARREFWIDYQPYYWVVGYKCTYGDPISCTAPFQLNQQDAGPLSGWGGSNPTGLARLPDGKFVAVWTWVQAQSPYYKEIHARVFNDDGTPYTNEFTVNAPGSMLTRLYPMARAIDADKFAVTWLSSYGIKGRVMGANGNPLCDEFLVSDTGIPSGFKNPQVASAWDSKFRIGWIENPGGGEERYVKWAGYEYASMQCPQVEPNEYIDQILGPKSYPSLHAACWCDTTAIGAWAYKCTGTTFPQCVNFRIKKWW